MKVRLNLCCLDSSAAYMEGAAEKVPTVTMVAYSGGIMTPAMSTPGSEDCPYEGHAIIVDLAGMTSDADIPLLYNHSVTTSVGHVDSLEIGETQIKASGVLSRENEEREEIVKSWKSGFPWKPSIGCSCSEIEEVKAGEVVNVNGRRFQGPLFVARKSTLEEISFVSKPADRLAELAIKAQLTETTTMENENPVIQEPVETPVENPAEGVQVTANDAGVKKQLEDYRRKMAEDFDRIVKIQAMCKDWPEIGKRAIQNGLTLDQTELEVLRAEKAQGVAHLTAHSSDQGAFDAKVIEAAMARDLKVFASDADLVAEYGEQTLDAAEKLKRIGFRKLGAAAGIRGEYQDDKAAWLRAFTTTSLPLVFEDVANKMMMQTIKSRDTTYREICSITSVPNYQVFKRYRVYDSMLYEPIGPDGRIKQAQPLEEEKFTISVDKKALMFTIDDQILVDDDMGVFRNAAQWLVDGWLNTVNYAVWSEFMNDTNNFYNATDHSLLTNKPLSTDNLIAAYQEFMKKTLPTGEDLGFEPKTLLVPPALMFTAKEILHATWYNETTAQGKRSAANYNPVAGMFNLVVANYLKSTRLSANASDTTYYLLSDKDATPAIELAFLNGQESPIIESAQANFDQYGIQFRGCTSFGVKKQDNRGVLKVTGS